MVEKISQAMRRTVACVLAQALTWAASVIWTGTGFNAPGEDCRSTASSDDVVILVSATATDPKPALTPMAVEALRKAADSRNARNPPSAVGSSARVTSADGGFTETFGLTPRRENNCHVEHGMQREKIIRENVDRVTGAVAGVQAGQPGLDLVKALDDATRGAPPSTLIVMSHGLSTRGGIDLRQVGWQADPQKVADDLRGRELLPSLSGWRVIFTGLGSSVGAQPPLPRPQRLKLIAYWKAICATAGAAECVVDETPPELTPSAATAKMPLVDVPEISSAQGPNGDTTLMISDKLLGFSGDSAALSAEAVRVIGDVAARINASGKPETTVYVTGYCADPPRSTPESRKQISSARAQAVAEALRSAGVTNDITVKGSGAVGTAKDASGKFHEEIAVTMRKVEINFK